MMDFKVVFDAANQSSVVWPQAAIPLVLLGVGALLVFAPDLMRRLAPHGLQGRARTIFSYVFFTFALGTTIFTFKTMIGGRSAAAEALRSGHYSVVEGPVTKFVPMPYTGHAMESFVVGGNRFSYSDYILTPGFHNTASHGGPIHEGLYVRIAYVGNDILRLEVRE
jgi:hypothetical protein